MDWQRYLAITRKAVEVATEQRARVVALLEGGNGSAAAAAVKVKPGRPRPGGNGVWLPRLNEWAAAHDGRVEIAAAAAHYEVPHTRITAALAPLVKRGKYERIGTSVYRRVAAPGQAAPAATESEEAHDAQSDV